MASERDMELWRHRMVAPHPKGREQREEREETAAGIEAIAQRLREHAPTVTDRHSIAALLDLYADSLRPFPPSREERQKTEHQIADILAGVWDRTKGVSEAVIELRPFLRTATDDATVSPTVSPDSDADPPTDRKP